MTKYHFIFFLVFTFTSVLGQTDPVVDDFELPYDERIKLAYINEKYIPKDLDDCFSYIKLVSDEAGLEKFKQAEEDIIARKLHFGLGKWIMANWALVDGSRYSHYLKELGISHPDDMVQFTIVSLHRHLNEKDLEITKRVQEYRDKRLQELLEWQENARLNKVDTLK